MFCGTCGSENPTEHHFCAMCGQALQIAARRQSESLRVILQSVRQDNIVQTVRRLQVVRQLSLHEATRLVTETPSIIASSASRAEADAIKDDLAPLGAELVIAPEDELLLRSGPSGNQADGRPPARQKLIYLEAAGVDDELGAAAFAALICGWLACYQWAWQLGGGLLGVILTMGFATFAIWRERILARATKRALSGVGIGLSILRCVLAVPLWLFGVHTLLSWLLVNHNPNTTVADVLVRTVALFPQLSLAVLAVGCALGLGGVWRYLKVLCPVCETTRYVLNRAVSFQCAGCKQRILVKNGVGVRLRS